MNGSKPKAIAKLVKVGRLKQLGYFYFFATVAFAVAVSSILI